MFMHISQVYKGSSILSRYCLSYHLNQMRNICEKYFNLASIRRSPTIGLMLVIRLRRMPSIKHYNIVPLHIPGFKRCIL